MFTTTNKNGGRMEKVGYRVTRVTEEAGLRCVRISGISSTLDLLDTNEWQIILAALAAGRNSLPSPRRGFTYTFPLALG